MFHTVLAVILTGVVHSADDLWPQRSQATTGCDYTLKIGECIAFVREPDPGEAWTVHTDRHCAQVWLTYPDEQVRILQLKRRDSPVSLDVAGHPATAECAAFDVVPAGY